MSSEDYRRALDAACKEYEKLGQERTLIDARLSQLAQSIGTLMRLCGMTSTVPWGLTDACRVVLRNAGVPMSPTEVRDRLVSSGYDLTRYSNELAAIHTILRRLNDSGEIQFVSAPGKHLYRWKAPPKVIAIGPEVAEFLRHSGETHIAGSKPPKRKK
jgi:hypothetical protein